MMQIECAKMENKHIPQRYINECFIMKEYSMDCIAQNIDTVFNQEKAYFYERVKD